jgi:hypothetical protein
MGPHTGEDASFIFKDGAAASYRLKPTANPASDPSAFQRRPTRDTAEITSLSSSKRF